MKTIKILVVSLVLVFICFEVLIGLMLAYPELAKYGPRNLLRNIYLTSYRNIIQLDPQFSRFDPYLKYTLKPGTFTFHNSEFSNEFKVNKIGVRDDEQSLLSPEIIVIGDSVPMGWGVNQDETYAELMEEKSGIRVLNAAVASYSTVEAVRILDRIDTSKVKYLVLFYMHWKFSDNKRFFIQKDKYETLSEAEYNQKMANWKKSMQYYPGRYIFFTFRSIFDQMLTKIYPSADSTDSPLPENEAKVLLNAIFKSGHIDFDKVQMIVICEEDFVDPIAKTVIRDYPDFIGKIKPLGMIDFNRENSYFLDDHPTAIWHKQMADRIMKLLK